MKPRRVVIVVDRLSIPGHEPGSGERVGQAFRTELARLVQVRGVPIRVQAGGHAPFLRLPTLPRSGLRGPESLGRALAGSLYESLDRPPGSER